MLRRPIVDWLRANMKDYPHDRRGLADMAVIHFKLEQADVSRWLKNIINRLYRRVNRGS